MGHRLSKITTRTGDQGTTGLATGERVTKDAPRIRAMGAVDELNSWIGLVLSQTPSGEVSDCLREVQQGLFEVGAELSLPGRLRVTQDDLATLDDAVQAFNARLDPLREFILPGGNPAAATCHVARTVCRRAETQVVALRSLEPEAASLAIPYLNRLSDLLFVLARVLNKEAGTPETLWRNVRGGDR
jgi:cob(I)alamin adenosyltransferase